MITPGVTVEHERTLLDAVDALTRPRTVANWQGARLVRRVDPPLLGLLYEAVASDVGGTGSGKPAQERVPLDIGALELHREIASRVRSWVEDLGGRVGRDIPPQESLRAWYVLFNAQPYSSVLANDYRVTLEGWVHQIESKIDPPRRIEIGEREAVPCPECGASFVLNGHVRLDGEVDPNEAEQVRALAVFELGTLEESFAACAVCGARWVGVGRLRALRIAIDDAEASRAAEQPKPYTDELLYGRRAATDPTEGVE